jgi:hypothetical protein
MRLACREQSWKLLTEGNEDNEEGLREARGINGSEENNKDHRALSLAAPPTRENFRSSLA